MKYTFQDNPFWQNEEKTQAMSILTIEDDNGKTSTEQRLVRKGESLWEVLMQQIGPKKIDQNTEERRQRKVREKNEGKLKKIQQDKSIRMEELFTMKLKAFEIKEVRECPDKRLRTKVRAAKNDMELYGWISVILGKSLELENEED